MLEQRQADTVFIPARVGDNAFNNPEYRKELEGLTGWQKRAWLDGDWDMAAGQHFTTLGREVYVIEDFDPTDAGRAREWFAAMDYGFAHCTVLSLGCRDGDGNVFIVDKHAERLWLPQRHAVAIKAILAWRSIGREHQARRLEPDDLKRFAADADDFSRQSDETTIAAQYAKQGITLRVANTDRINGWAEVMQRLGEVAAPPADGPAGRAKAGSQARADAVRPTLFIHKRCGRLIETLPALQHDPNRP